MHLLVACEEGLIIRLEQKKAMRIIEVYDLCSFACMVSIQFLCQSSGMHTEEAKVHTLI